MKKLLTIMAASVAATVFGGYGDLPDTFDASTGYVTLDTTDRAGDESSGGFSSFYVGDHWSDGEAPHSNANYYVPWGKMLATPRGPDSIVAKLAVDPTCLTFKGDIVVAAGEVRGQSSGYEFTIPDLRMLPGSDFYWGAPWPTLRGDVTVYGTEASPVRFDYYLSGDGFRQEVAQNVKGDASSWLSVRAPRYGDRSDKLAYVGHIALTGDLSEFFGTLKIDDYLANGAKGHSSYFGYEFANSSVSNAAVTVGNQGSIYLTAPEGVEVRSLSINGADTIIRILNSDNWSHDVPRFTVREALALNGHSVSLALCSYTLQSKNGGYVYSVSHITPEPAEDVALIRLKPAAVANGLPRDLYESFTFGIADTKAKTEWLPDPDGGMTLWRPAYVMCQFNDAQDRSSMTNTLTSSGSNNFWSNGLNPADDPDSATKRYFSDKTMHVPRAAANAPFAFGGGALVLNGGSFNMYNGGYGFYCKELVLKGATFMMCNASHQGDQRKDDEDGGYYTIYRIQGEKLVVPAPYVNTFNVWGVRKLMRIESEVVGGGTIKCSTFAAGDYNNDRSFYEFTALNTNFTGKINVSMPYETKYAIPVPNWNQRTRLFVYDERNLGGGRDTFAYDALYLDHYAELFPLNDVTFTDGWNRGIAIGDIGRMNVTNNLTLSILRPLNVNGNLVKDGAGTLALGGTLTFNGATQSATPTANKNLLTVRGGSIKPLAAHAFDGLAITFTNNASIKLDATTADADLLNYGIVNVKETTAPIALAANQSVIPVTVTPPENGDVARFAVAICTVGESFAETLPVEKFSVARAGRYRCNRVEKRSNGDGTVTYLASFFVPGAMLVVW